MKKPKAAAKAKAKGGGKKAAKSGAKRAPFKAPVEAKTGKPPAGTPKAEAIVARVTPAATLKSLLSTCRGYKANSDSIISKMREEIGFAVEKKHLEKGAFALLRKFDKMEAEKGAELWHTLVRYMELSGVMAKIDAVGRLPLGDDDGEEVETETPAPAVKARGGRKDKNGAANGDDKPVMPPHPGIDPAEETTGENVSRPQFGGARQAGISGEELGEAVKH